MPGQVGVDSYTYHRLLGEVRPRRDAAARTSSRAARSTSSPRRAGSSSTSRCCRRASSATRPRSRRPRISPRPATSRSGSRGARSKGSGSASAPTRSTASSRGSPRAAQLGLPVMRIVAGGPAHRGRPLGPGHAAFCARPAPPRATTGSCSRSRTTAISRPSQIERLLDAVGDDLRVCFDTANALRVGDDVAAAARRLCAGDRDPAPEGLRRLVGRPRHRSRLGAARRGRDPGRGGARRVPRRARVHRARPARPRPPASGRSSEPTSSTFAPDDGAAPFDLSGRRALVTGGGGGIGLGISEALAAAGARVAVLGRSATADEAAGARRRDRGPGRPLRPGRPPARVRRRRWSRSAGSTCSSRATARSTPGRRSSSSLDDWDDTSRST